MEESTADKSGKPFTTHPNSSQVFVVVGRNVDQWRASLGLEEGEDVWPLLWDGRNRKKEKEKNKSKQKFKVLHFKTLQNKLNTKQYQLKI